MHYFVSDDLKKKFDEISSTSLSMLDKVLFTKIEPDFARIFKRFTKWYPDLESFKVLYGSFLFTE